MAKAIQINNNGDLVLSGDINLKTVSAIYADSLLLLKGKKKFFIDFSNVMSFDSAIISLMLSWLRFIKQHVGQEIFFKNIPEKLHYLIEAYKLDETIRVSHD